MARHKQYGLIRMSNIPPEWEASLDASLKIWLAQECSRTRTAAAAIVAQMGGGYKYFLYRDACTVLKWMYV